MPSAFAAWGLVVVAVRQRLDDGVALHAVHVLAQAAAIGRDGHGLVGQVLAQQLAAAREAHGAVHGVLELQHVARPRVAAQPRHGARRPAHRRGRAGLEREARGQRQDVRRARAQRRQLHRRAREQREQLGVEGPARHQARDGPLRGADHPEGVTARQQRLAHGHVGVTRQVAQLVQQQRATARRVDARGLVGVPRRRPGPCRTRSASNSSEQ
jgi:hypothetical protein